MFLTFVLVRDTGWMPALHISAQKIRHRVGEGTKSDGTTVSHYNCRTQQSTFCKQHGSPLDRLPSDKQLCRRHGGGLGQETHKWLERDTASEMFDARPRLY